MSMACHNVGRWMSTPARTARLLEIQKTYHGWAAARIWRRILAIRVKLVDKKVIFAIRDKLPLSDLCTRRWVALRSREVVTSQGSSRTIFAGANFLPAKQNRASPRGEHLANQPLGAIITIRPLHALRLAILTESLTTPLGRCHPFWLIWKHVVFKLRHHYFWPSGGVLPLSCCCPFILV